MTDTLSRLRRVLGDHYAVEKELGEGGMATVFLAEDLKHHRKVAIKVLLPDLSRDLGQERFLLEIATTANLRHPHILPLYDSGVAEDILYYVMPFVSGESLRDRMKREGPLAVDEALRIARDVGSALAYAHGQGVIHRDIKPENILIEGEHAVVADFGIALAVNAAGGDVKLTKEGMAMGTPTYISPEQVTGKGAPDGRADLYALGCVLYEMLTGRPPFVGETVEKVLRQHLATDPERITKLRPTVSEEVDHVVMRALAKNPDDRFHTEEFVAALTTGESGTLQIPSMGPPRWLVPALVGAATVILVAGVAAFFLLRGGEAPVPTVETRTQLTLEEALEVDPALSPDGEMVAYAAGERGRMQIFVRHVAGGRAVRLSEDTTRHHRWPRWTPDGERVTYEVDGGILAVPSLGGPAQRIFPLAPDDSVGGLAWSPDGSQVAFVRTAGIYLRDLDSGEERLLTEAVEPYSPAWSPDGKYIVYVSGNRQGMFASYFFGNSAPSSIQIVPVGGGEATTLLSPNALHLSPVWTPDGKYLFFISGRGGGRDLFRVRIAEGKVAGEPERVTTGLDADAISLSADGSKLAYSHRVTTANLWAMAIPQRGSGPVSFRDANRLTSGSQRIERSSISPDGQWLAFDSDRSGNFDIYIMPIGGGEARAITSDPADDFGPDWSPDGEWLVFHSFRHGNRDLFIASADGTSNRQLTNSPLHEMRGGWSPDQTEMTFSRAEWEGIFRMPVTDEAGDRFELIMERACCAVWSVAANRIAALQLAQGSSGRSVVTLLPDGSELQVLATSDVDGGVEIVSADWGADGRYVYYLATTPEGGKMYRVDAATAQSELLIELDDPDRQPVLWDLSVGHEVMVLELGDHESDVWVMDLEYK